MTSIWLNNQFGAVVEIQFLFWSIQMSRSLLMFLLLAIGVIIGWFLHSHLKGQKD